MDCRRLAKSRLVNLVAMICVLAANFAAPNRARAIVINIEYTDEGDPVPHDENPEWDPDGRILKRHFQAAKTIWERLLAGRRGIHVRLSLGQRHWREYIGADHGNGH